MVKSKAKKQGLSDKVNATKNQTKRRNVFEIQVNKQKFKVLGRKSNNDIGLPGVARGKALKKRKATLLQEYKVMNKSNQFIDKRIGEKNSAMTAEDKVLARFAAERVKAHNKKAKFNLADDEVLTHRGRSLEEIEKFDDPRSDDEDDYDDPMRKGLNAKFVEEAHFGGGMLRRADSSRMTVIEQLIADSKKRKAEKMKDREKTLELTDKLDEDWKELVPVLSMGKSEEEKTRKERDSYDLLMNELKYDARGQPSDRLKTTEEIAELEAKKLQQLEEERLRRMRGDDLEEEVEEEVFTRKKSKHISADDLDDDFEIDDKPFSLVYDKDGVLIGTPPPSYVPKRNADLEAFLGGPVIGSDEEGDEDEEEGSDEDGDEDDEDEEEEEGEEEDPQESGNEEDTEAGDEAQSSEINEAAVEELSKSEVAECNDEFNEDAESNDDSNENPEGNGKVNEDGESNKDADCHAESNEDADYNAESNEDAKQESDVDPLPKTSPSIKRKREDGDDESHKEDLHNPIQEKKKVSFNSEVQVQTIKKKVEDPIRKQPIALDLPYTFEVPSSYDDLQELFKDREPEIISIILERMIKCNHPGLSKDNKDKLADLIGFLLQYITSSSPDKIWKVILSTRDHLYTLTQFCPNEAEIYFRSSIIERYEKLQNSKYPSLDSYFYLTLIDMLYSTSDKFHTIASPALCFMEEALSRCKVTSRRSVSCGLYLVQLVIKYVSLSKRICPSALSFLCGILHLASPPTKHPAPAPFENNHKFLFLSETHRDSTDFKMRLSDMASKEKIDADFRVRSLATALFLANELISTYSTVPYIHFFADCLKVYVENCKVDNYPEEVIERRTRLISTIESLSSKPVVAEPKKEKPKILKLLDPKVEPVYEGCRKKKNVSVEKAELEKLLHKVKREKKGALREIRRDRNFLMKVKLREQAASDAERIRKVKQIYSWASEQQGDLRKLERSKKKK